MVGLRRFPRSRFPGEIGVPGCALFKQIWKHVTIQSAAFRIPCQQLGECQRGRHNRKTSDAERAEVLLVEVMGAQ